MKTRIVLKLTVASALCASSMFAAALGVAAATCPGTPITGFGNSAFGTWQTCGPVSQVGSTVTIDTTTQANNASLATLNAFLSPQSVSSQDGITPVNGAALKTTFTSGAGNLSFNFNFLADVATESFGFLLLDGTQYDLGHNILVLTTVTPSMSIAIGAGSHNIAFGVMDGNSALADPTLTISNLVAPTSGVPEPATFGLAAAALGLVFFVRRKIAA